MPVPVAIVGVVLAMAIMVVRILSIIADVIAATMMVSVPITAGNCQKCHCAN